MNLKFTKRIAAIGLAAMMSGCMLSNPATMDAISETFAITASAATASGNCGSGLTWSLTGDTLTITGSGTTMTNYTSTTAPWKSYASQIKKVIFPKTLKSIGNYAFYNMSALEYVYTKNGSINAPTFPDVTNIGKYAFANCYNFRGNTENGKMTLGMGTSSVMQNGNIRVCDSAFQNCDKVRFLYVNFASMYVESWGFYSMNMLSSVSMPDTKVTLCSYAFYNSSSLATVNYKQSVNPIHKTAFSGTSYYNNKCTNAAVYGQNYGNAKTMTGTQLIVNIFLDMTKVNLGWGDGGYTRWGSANYVFPLESGEVAAKGKNNTYYAFKKNNMTYEHIFSWNAKKTATQSDNTVVSLNKIDYTSLANPSKIAKNIVDNSESSGFFGSNVTSADIQQRLSEVRAAANDLEAQNKNYTTNAVKFKMYPETNFYLTYDSFDWTTTKETIKGTTYDIMGGYVGLVHSYLYDGVNLSDSSDNPLFASLKKASQRHTGNVTQTVDLCSSSRTSFSSYTNYLKQQYGVDGVIYLLHFKAEGQSFANQNSEKKYFGTDELAFIMKKTGNSSQQKLMMAHEICHLYGSHDYYCAGNLTQAEANYCQTNFYEDVMNCKYNLPIAIGPATAYSIGWLDRLDSTVFNNVFASQKKS